MNIKLSAALLCGAMGLAAPRGYAHSLPELLDGVLRTHPSLRAQQMLYQQRKPKFEKEMASVKAKLRERKDVLVHTELAVPVPGVVKPGMTASIDIRTGTRSVLSYLVKPVFKAFGGALIER